jgi:predicted MFS family arabinose efflux permease
MRPETSVGGPDLRGLSAALRVVTGNPVLLGAFATDLAATVLAFPFALFPVINDQVYGGSPVTLGLFAPAVGLGGLLASALSGPMTRSPRPGRLMLVASALWATSLAAFGMGHVLWVALACLAVAGAADSVSVVTRSSLVQHATPDAARGRVGAIDFLVGVSGPQLGSFRAGLVASATSGATSAVIGGVASLVALAVVAATTPSLRRWSPTVSVAAPH